MQPASMDTEDLRIKCSQKILQISYDIDNITYSFSVYKKWTKTNCCMETILY